MKIKAIAIREFRSSDENGAEEGGCGLGIYARCDFQKRYHHGQYFREKE
jgi:hypothetical protein